MQAACRPDPYDAPVASTVAIRTLVVTNDFPPREGGIQTFVYELAIRQPAESIVVLAPSWAGAPEFDATLPFPVARHRGTTLLPTPEVRRTAVNLFRAQRCDSVWFGAAAPLGLLARPLRLAGARRIVASTHGHEAGWAIFPGARTLLGKIGRDCDLLTYLGDFTRRRVASVVGNEAPMIRLPPGVETERFHPGVDGSALRASLGVSDRPTVLCVSRLVPRKGQDILIRALPLIHRRVPGAALLLVGGGYDVPRLERLAVTERVADDVVFVGSVSADDLPQYYAAADVFAMPCRTRRAGLEAEGLGIVYLEAQATGLPVVAGQSGGAPDAVRDGETGYVVDGRSVEQVADRVATLLADPVQAKAMGEAGRQWVEAQWRWDVLAHRLAEALAGSAAVSDSW